MKRNKQATKRYNNQESVELAKKAAQLTLDKKAYDVTILDLRGLTDATDCFVITSADSPVQVRAITDHVVEKLKEQEVRPWHVEGYSYGRWVLIDYINIIVHVFHSETRKFYQLERLWGDARVEVIESVENG